MFNLRDKVVPVSKSAGTRTLDASVAWMKAVNRNQPYLYVNGIHGDEIVCGEDICNDGDYFKSDDLVPYVEPQPVVEDIDVMIDTLNRFLKTKIEEQKKIEEAIVLLKGIK